MFDIGFSELLVVGVVALVVIGPERLPKVARTAGVLLGRMQRYVQNVKADISREMQLDELKKLQAEMQESARNFEQTIASEVQTIGKDVGEAVESAKLGGGTNTENSRSPTRRRSMWSFRTFLPRHCLMIHRPRRRQVFEDGSARAVVSFSPH
ncbi:Sec-independent protein translocase protein TatB [Propionivibrio sp.]|uniref:Sec-independent protein translocase protein TatB n=1 Tax=Propionivibrio sp. TaxID=2212460 RepID=UPI00272EC0B3|nr:Sec-independent protein translocase protein TatB [Propionivibrio sp.]